MMSSGERGRERKVGSNQDLFEIREKPDEGQDVTCKKKEKSEMSLLEQKGTGTNFSCKLGIRKASVRIQGHFVAQEVNVY